MIIFMNVLITAGLHTTVLVFSFASFFWTGNHQVQPSVLCLHRRQKQVRKMLFKMSNEQIFVLKLIGVQFFPNWNSKKRISLWNLHKSWSQNTCNIIWVTMSKKKGIFVFEFRTFLYLGPYTHQKGTLYMSLDVAFSKEAYLMFQQ